MFDWYSAGIVDDAQRLPARSNCFKLTRPLGSRDLEDILALVASRPSLPDEVRNSPAERHALIVGKTKGF